MIFGKKSDKAAAATIQEEVAPKAQASYGTGYGTGSQADDGRRRLTVIAGAASAVAVASLALGIAQYGRAAALSRAYEGDLRTVVVAASDVPAGTTLTGEMLATEDVPAAYVPTDATDDPSGLVGRKAAADLTSGIPVGTSQVAGYGTTGVLGTSVDEGKVAYMLSLDQAAGLSPLLHVGERVSVLCCYTGAAPEKVAEAVRVVALGSTTGGTETEADGYATVTLELSEDQASKLVEYTSNSGTVQLEAVASADAAAE